MGPPRVTRRRFAAVAAGSVGALAGCVATESDDNGDPDDREAGAAPSIDGRELALPIPLELVDPGVTDPDGHVFGDDLVAHVHWHGDDLHWHEDPVDVGVDDRSTVRIRFLDADREVVRLDEESRYGAGAQARPVGPLDLGIDADLLHLRGLAPGSVELSLQLWRGDDLAWTAPPLDVRVADRLRSNDRRVDTREPAPDL